MSQRDRRKIHAVDQSGAISSQCGGPSRFGAWTCGWMLRASYPCATSNAPSNATSMHLLLSAPGSLEVNGLNLEPVGAAWRWAELKTAYVQHRALSALEKSTWSRSGGKAACAARELKARGGRVLTVPASRTSGEDTQSLSQGAGRPSGTLPRLGTETITTTAEKGKHTGGPCRH